MDKKSKSSSSSSAALPAPLAGKTFSLSPTSATTMSSLRLSVSRFGRKSRPASIISQSSSLDSRAQVSCFTHEVPTDECELNRFVVWAACKRNLSNRMTDEDRRRCPLLPCSQIFPDHSGMLQHLYGCEHLSSGQYFCHECGRTERFNCDPKSRRCLAGHSSRRRKMVSKAKHFFSSLGHKARSGSDEIISTIQDDYPAAYYHSNGDDPANLGQAELPPNEIFEADSNEITGDGRPAAEFQATIHQFSPPIRLDPPLPVWQPSSPTSNSGPGPGGIMPYPTAAKLWQDMQALSGSVSPAASAPAPAPTPPSVPALSGPQRPRATKPLAPSSSVRSTASTSSTGSTDSTFSALSGVSTLSTVSTASMAQSVLSPDAQGLDQFGCMIYPPYPDCWTKTTPAPAGPLVTGQLPSMDDLQQLLSDLVECPVGPPFGFLDPSGPDMFSPAFHYNLSVPSQSLMPAELQRQPPQQPLPPPLSLSPALPALPPAPAHHHDRPPPLPSPPPPTAQRPADAQAGLSPEPSFKLEPGPDHKLQDDNPCSAVHALLESVRSSLQAHATESLGKMRKMQNNELAMETCDLCPDGIAAKGLEAFGVLLTMRRQPTSVEMLCFAHVAYAFTYALDDRLAQYKSGPFYAQSLQYGQMFDPQVQIQFGQIAKAIWEPAEIAHRDSAAGLSASLVSCFGRPETLLVAGGAGDLQSNGDRVARVPAPGEEASDVVQTMAQYFLDSLESAVLCDLGRDPSTAGMHDLGRLHGESWVNHVGRIDLEGRSDDPFRAMALTLGQIYSGNTNLVQEIQRIRQLGPNTSVRRAEVELLEAGRSHLPWRSFFEEFAPLVRRQCDMLYAPQPYGDTIRAWYYLKGIKLIESVFSSARPAQHTAAPTGAMPDHDPMTDIQGWDGMAMMDAGSPQPQTRDLFMLTPSSGFLDGSASSMSRPSGSESHPTALNMVIPSGLATLASQNQLPTPTTPQSCNMDSQPQTEIVEAAADDRCTVPGCRYRPKGDPKWFKGSMSKHMKNMHRAEPAEIYRCNYPGCNSQYKNRPDNLRQHQLDKKHFVDTGADQMSKPKKRKLMTESA